MDKYEALKKVIKDKIESNAEQMEKVKGKNEAIYNQCVRIEDELKDLLECAKHFDLMK